MYDFNELLLKEDNILYRMTKTLQEIKYFAN